MNDKNINSIDSGIDVFISHDDLIELSPEYRNEYNETICTSTMPIFSAFTTGCNVAIGTSSVSTGYNNIAIGTSSVLTGCNNIAIGTSSTHSGFPDDVNALQCESFKIDGIEYNLVNGNGLDNSIYTYNFGVYPDVYQPSGHINFSHINMNHIYSNDI